MLNQLEENLPVKKSVSCGSKRWFSNEVVDTKTDTSIETRVESPKQGKESDNLEQLKTCNDELEEHVPVQHEVGEQRKESVPAQHEISEKQRLRSKSE